MPPTSGGIPAGGMAGGGGTGGGSDPDPCFATRRGPINSPKQAVLSKLAVGAVLDVQLRPMGATFGLAVVDASGADAGSLTFANYFQIVQCMQTRQIQYTATIIRISGGIYEVRVDPV